MIHLQTLSKFGLALNLCSQPAMRCSLKDMLYQRRMARQLAAARGQIAAPEKPPEDDVSAA